MLHSIPWGIVCLAGLSSELLLGVADPTSGAVIWADSALAGDTVVVVEALTLAGLAVAQTLVRTLNFRVCLVCSSGNSNPSSGLWTSTEGAVVLSPCGVTVWTSVAHTLIVSSARSVARASVGAVSRCQSSETRECNEQNCTSHLKDNREGLRVKRHNLE
jgi:hypothetical protein